ncbi:aryl-alcohol dehydrogenase [Mycena rosella]|uniref:Aryl-alcohol dehydrogenase n=1 Tax=Mycena rosella TaxID=1033263 RepID=A0AAD7CP92_MYCRO|nr:aryl-alcohol dehydrogenase [Mycena rosella]
MARLSHLHLWSSGLKVLQITLGCMLYASKQWESWVLEEEEATKHIKFAYDVGIQTFDIANIYSNGESEVLLGKELKTPGLPREEIVAMTKVRLAVGKTLGTDAMGLFVVGPENIGYVNPWGLSRKHIFDSVKASLKRLQLEYIDILQVHRFDYDIPVAETMQALHAGYVHYAIAHNLTPFISMQNQYSFVHREEEHEMMPTLQHFGVARGAVCRPYSSPDPTKQTVRQGSNTMPADAYFHLGASNSQLGRILIPNLNSVAKKHNAMIPQISLAWVMAKDEVTAPIVGTISLEKLEYLRSKTSSVNAVNVNLTTEEIKYFEEPYTPMAIMAFW